MFFDNTRTVSSGGSRNQKRGVPRVGRNTVRSCARGTRSIVTYYCELEKGGSVAPSEPPLDPPLVRHRPCYDNTACTWKASLCPAAVVLSQEHLVNIPHPPCSGWVSEQLYYRQTLSPRVRVWLVRLGPYTRHAVVSFLAPTQASCIIFRDKAGCYVVENRCITSGAAFCVEGRR